MRKEVLLFYFFLANIHKKKLSNLVFSDIFRVTLRLIGRLVMIARLLVIGGGGSVIGRSRLMVGRSGSVIGGSRLVIGRGWGMIGGLGLMIRRLGGGLR